MKCFRIILIFISFSISAQEKLNIESVEKIHSVVPLEVERNIIKNNEIYEVAIDSELSDEELQKVKNGKINEVMYVMDVFIDGDDRFFRVFVTDPPKKAKKDKENKIETYFDMSSFQYDPSNKEKTPDFLTMDLPYELPKSRSELMKTILIILGAMFFFPLSLLTVKGSSMFLGFQKRKRFKKNRAKELIELFEDSKLREDFEKIYMLKKEFELHIEWDDNSFQKFLKCINNYQYQKNWDQEILNEVNKSKRAVGQLRVSRGI